MLIISETGEIFFLGEEKKVYRLEAQEGSVVYDLLGEGFFYTGGRSFRLTYDGEEGRVSVYAKHVVR